MYPFYHLGPASAVVYNCHPQREDMGAFVKPRARHLPIEVRGGAAEGCVCVCVCYVENFSHIQVHRETFPRHFLL